MKNENVIHKEHVWDVIKKKKIKRFSKNCKKQRKRNKC